MGLQLKIRAKEFKNSFTIYDCTGKYSSENTGGFGIKNPKIEDLTDSYFEIYPPEAISPIKIVVFPDFPNEDDFGYEVLPNQLGMQYLVSGTYKINYVVTWIENGVEKTAKTTIIEVFINNAQCCVDKLIKNVDQNAFSDKKQKLYIELNALMSVVRRTKCNYPFNAQKILKYVTLQCQCGAC